MACQQSAKSVDEIVDQEMNLINWQMLDRLPEFTTSSDAEDSTGVRKFQKALYNYIKLDSIIYAEQELIQDSLMINVSISKNGQFELVNISSENKKQTQKLASVLNTYFLELNPIKPAYKRGVPVAVKFNIPLIIK